MPPCQVALPLGAVRSGFYDNAEHRLLAGHGPKMVVFAGDGAPFCLLRHQAPLWSSLRTTAVTIEHQSSDPPQITISLISVVSNISVVM